MDDWPLYESDVETTAQPSCPLLHATYSRKKAAFTNNSPLPPTPSVVILKIVKSCHTAHKAAQATPASIARVLLLKFLLLLLRLALLQSVLCVTHKLCV